MKFIVERDALADAIGSVFRATRGAPDIPILKNIMITATDREIMVTATNLAVMSHATVPADVTVPGDGITVIGDVFDRVVGLFPQGSQVRFEYEEGQHAIVSCGRSQYKLHTLPASDFPVLESPEMPARFTIPSADLVAGLDATRFAIEKPNGRLYLTGVYLCVDNSDHYAFGGSTKKRLQFVATNGGEFARRAVPLPEAVTSIPAVIIPEGTVDEIIRLSKAAGGDIEIGLSSNLIEAKTAKATLVSRLVDASYPNFKAALPPGCTHKAIFETKAMLQAIARLSSLGDARTARASFSDAGLRLNARSAAAGSAEEVVEIEFDGEGSIEFGVKLSGLKSCIEAAASDVCVFRMNSQHGTTLINPISEGEVDYDATFLSMKLK